MNGKNKISASNPLSEMREGLADEWAGPEVEMTAAEHEVWWKEFLQSLETGRQEIAEGRGIPAEVVFAEIKARLEAKRASKVKHPQ